MIEIDIVGWPYSKSKGILGVDAIEFLALIVWLRFYRTPAALIIMDSGGRDGIGGHPPSVCYGKGACGIVGGKE